MEKVLIIGASGHAKVIIEAIELNKEYEVFGFIDSYKPIGDKVLGYEILGNEEAILGIIDKGIHKGIIAIGDNWTRYLMCKKIKDLSLDFEFITVIHPSAIISPYAKIGKGTAILASGIVNTDAVVGDFCIINTNASFGHDGVMKDFSSLAPGVTVGGNVSIGEFTAISLSSTIIQGLSIGKHTVIGAGAVVTHNIESYQIAYGIPAKNVRKRKKGESYFSNEVLDTNFKAYTVHNEEELLRYKQVVEVIQNSNPFYKTELLGTTNMDTHQFSYFVLEKNSIPIIIMPFYIRKIHIDGEETLYKDVTSPYGYSGPLFDTEVVNIDISRHFWKQVDLWYKKKKIVSEFIRFNLLSNQIQYSGELIPTLKNVRGKIIDQDQQWANLKPKVRNNYRKAVKEGLRLEVYTSPISLDIIKDFYDIYIQTMQRNKAHSQYFHYIDYFKKFILENPESAVIAMVYKEFVPISTELILLDQNTLYSYLGGTMSDYFFARPNDFLKIEIINWARENNYKYYVLGGGREDDDSLYKYKKSFFPDDEDVIYYTGRKIVNIDVYKELVDADHKEELPANDNVNKRFFPLYRCNE